MKRNKDEWRRFGTSYKKAIQRLLGIDNLKTAPLCSLDEVQGITLPLDLTTFQINENDGINGLLRNFLIRDEIENSSFLWKEHFFTENVFDSPLEKTMFLALNLTVKCRDGISFKYWTGDLENYTDWSSRKLKHKSLEKELINDCGWFHLLIQIYDGKYRPDFQLVFYHEQIESFIKMNIEVDGHIYHEKTKEQALRDKRRDRYYLSKGITTMRFTGSEVWKDPFKCAEECFETFESMVKFDEHE